MDTLEDRIFRWFMECPSINRILLHPDDYTQAKKQYPDLLYMGLPIEFL